MSATTLNFFSAVLRETNGAIEESRLDPVATFLALPPEKRATLREFVGDLGSPQEWTLNFVPSQLFGVMPTIDLNPNGFTDGGLILIREYGGVKLGCPARDVIKEMMPIVTKAYVDIVAAPALGIDSPQEMTPHQ